MNLISPTRSGYITCCTPLGTPSLKKQTNLKKQNIIQTRNGGCQACRNKIKVEHLKIKIKNGDFLEHDNVY